MRKPKPKEPKTYWWRIKEGTYKFMRERILGRYELKHNLAPDMDGKICQTRDVHPIRLNIRPEYWLEMEYEMLFSVEILGIANRAFLVVVSQLNQLEEPIIIEY